uniref:Uncharacterized protein n=1 Tax=Rhizophora mucronata TaxID=61149 RepID=A0A2P2PBK3_RHIMU
MSHLHHSTVLDLGVVFHMNSSYLILQNSKFGHPI